MNKETSFFRSAASLVATGSLLLGCSPETGQASRTIDGIEFNYPDAEQPEVISRDLGIVPGDLPYDDLELRGKYNDRNGTTFYHTSARLESTVSGLEYRPHEDLDEEINKYFLSALSESEDLIAAALKLGNLNNIIFATALPEDEFTQSSYNPVGKVVAVTLDETGISYDELVATLRHELWHAVTYELTFSEEEWETDYSEACDRIDTLYRPEAINYVGDVVGQLLALYEQHKRAYPDEYESVVPALKEVDKYIETGRGTEDVMLYCGQLSVRYSLSQLEDSAGEFNDSDYPAISVIVPYGDIIATLDDSSPLKRALLREFIEGDTVYADYNESTYVQSDSVGSRLLGHSAEADNFSELFTSILNTTTRYTDEFAKRIAEMHPAERDFTFMFLRLTIKNTIVLSPQLADQLNSTENYLRQKVAELL